MFLFGRQTKRFAKIAETRINKMTTNEAITKLFGENAKFPAACVCNKFTANTIAGGIMHARKIHRIKFSNQRNNCEPIMQAKRTIRFK
jgi:hypothetical protein